MTSGPVVPQPEPAGRPAGGAGSALVPCPPAARRHPRRRLLTGALSVLIVAAVFGFALPRFASYHAVWHSLTVVRWPGLVFIAATLLANQVATWAMITAAMPGLRLRDAAVVNLGSSAVANAVPAGGAVSMGVSWAMLSSWGFATADYVRYTLVSGLWNVFVRLGLPVAALALLAVSGGAGMASQAAAYAGAGLLVLVLAGTWALLRSESLARRAGLVMGKVAAACCRLVRRRSSGRAAALLPQFRASTRDLLARRGLVITATTLASHLSLWLVLLACLRSLGVTGAQVSLAASLFAFAFSRLLSVLPVTPGGVGVVELGLTGPLVAGQGPAVAARVAAAVLLFRALTYLLSIPLGAGAYVWWHWQQPRRRAPAPAVPAPAMPVPEPARVRVQPARGSGREPRLRRIVIAPDQAD
ncbi:MAG: UPF0104 family protein [Actinobacteria bacterium]|nr:UPF0104 family protein [Actinomycetota bacterium]